MSLVVCVLVSCLMIDLHNDCLLFAVCCLMFGVRRVLFVVRCFVSAVCYLSSVFCFPVLSTVCCLLLGALVVVACWL